MEEYIPYIIDAIIFLPIIIYIIIGMKRGFLVSVLSFALTFVCLVVAKLYAPQLCDVLFEKSDSIITSKVFTGISYVVMYFISRLLAVGLIKVLNLATKLPVIKPVNKILGGVLGFIRGIILSAVIVALITVLVYFCPDTEIAHYVDDTRILSYLSTQIILLF